jgi:hypothetical protein
VIDAILIRKNLAYDPNRVSRYRPDAAIMIADLWFLGRHERRNPFLVRNVGATTRDGHPTASASMSGRSRRRGHQRGRRCTDDPLLNHGKICLAMGHQLGTFVGR